MGEHNCKPGSILGTMREGECLTRFFGHPNVRQEAEATVEYCNRTYGDNYYLDVSRESHGGMSTSFMTTYVLRKKLSNQELIDQMCGIAKPFISVWRTIVNSLSLF